MQVSFEQIIMRQVFSKLSSAGKSVLFNLLTHSEASLVDEDLFTTSGMQVKIKLIEPI